MQAAAPFQDRFLAQVKLACELRAGLTVEHATQQQDHLGRPRSSKTTWAGTTCAPSKIVRV
jgi:hypothetical protein